MVHPQLASGTSIANKNHIEIDSDNTVDKDVKINGLWLYTVHDLCSCVTKAEFLINC